MNKNLLKEFSPMMLQTTDAPFDDARFIFELKFDGMRVLVYCDKNQTILQNRKGTNVSDTFPELLFLHKQCKESCILDGEIIFVDEKGYPRFEILQKRLLVKDKAKISFLQRKYPVSIVVFDILKMNNKNLTQLPLLKRKKLLEKNVKENQFIQVVKFIENEGIKFFSKIQNLSLEGMVAKKKDSIYQIKKRSYDWLKIKNFLHEDYIICGYIPDENGKAKHLILASKIKNKLAYQGVIYLPSKFSQVFVQDFARENKGKVLFDNLQENIIWLLPKLICTVKFVEKTKKGELRQPVFVGIRTDL